MRPLDGFRSIKLKLGALVSATVALTAVLATVATGRGVSPWVTVPVSVAVALGLTQFLARGMTSPLREMTAAARVMASGDYTRPVIATSNDEVGELARSFNSMAVALARVDRQRRDLVANVSHELRTPVSALRALLENLVDGVVQPDTEQLQVALAQTERLGRLVADLLDLSRVDAGLSRLDLAPLEVGSLLDEVVAEARLGDRPVGFRVEVDPPDLVIEADRARLHQLLANLLDNAGRHSPPAGTVHVRAYRAADGTVLEVADQGPGIPPEERQAAFERFTTGSNRDDGGTGLGLAIARWVTDLHGGTIEVVDSATGAMVRARIPHQPAPEPSRIVHEEHA